MGISKKEIHIETQETCFTGACLQQATLRENYLKSNLEIKICPKHFKVAGFLIACWIICWVAFYPGFMSSDSLVQFGMSKSLKFNDWHPPIMSWVWSVLGFIFPGPSGMLVLHICLVWASVYIWWKNYETHPLSWIIFLIPFLPWVLNFIGVLWKDVGLAFSLFALSGLALRTPSFGKMFLALMLAFYAINLRYNAILPAFPILFYLTYKWLRKPSIFKATTTSLIILTLCVLSGYFFNYSVLQSQKSKPSNYMMLDDLAYLSIKKNESFLPGISIDELKSCAAFEIGENKMVGRVFCLSNYPSYKKAAPLNAELKGIWLSKIREYPIDYLQFRTAAFSYLLRTPSDSPYYIWHPGIDENAFGFKIVPNGLTLVAERFVKSSAATFPFLFKPYWWLLLSTLLLISSFLLSRTETVSTARMLLISAIFYMGGYVLVTPMADFRYIYWSVVSISLALLILIVDWPGFRSSISIKRSALLLSLTLMATILILNYGRIAALNIDSVLNNSLQGERISLPNTPAVNDLEKTQDDYNIKGQDPYMSFDLSSQHLQASDISWLKFDFSCVDLSTKPELQLFWWGDQQSGPTESQSMTSKLIEGINLISLKNRGLAAIQKIHGIRLDLANSDACKAIGIKNVELIKREPAKFSPARQ